jgi:hypothetical protein
MAKFNFFILASHRSRVMEIQSYFFKRIRNKDEIKVHILATGHDAFGGKTEPIYYKCCEDLRQSGIDTEINITTGHRNYMQKIEYAQTIDGEYAFSMDEDLWMSETVIDWMMDNAGEILDDKVNLAISPVISNGIPTCDLFIQDFMTTEQKAELDQLIKDTHIPNIWGANYEHLNEATTKAKRWDYSLFYELVRKVNHHFKGIHPVRINFALNKRINEMVLENWDKLINVPYKSLYPDPRNLPYLCNSVFMIKSDTWRKIIADKSLFRDDFDEVPLNLYREKQGLNWVFVRNGYCLHMIYNTVSQHEYEHEFTTKCVEKIKS